MKFRCISNALIAFSTLCIGSSAMSAESVAVCAFSGFATSNNKYENFSTFCGSGNYGDRKIIYKIENNSKHVGPSSNNAIKRAMNTWTQASGITFIESSNNNADLRIRFVEASKSAYRNLVGNALAHALIHDVCAQGRVIEIDESEHTWSDGKNPNSFDIETVVLHEIGHILGFDHSNSSTSTMKPSVSSNFLGRKLNEIDLSGLSFLYPGSYSGTGDTIRGFSWDSSTKKVSYPVYFPNENTTKMIVRSFEKPNKWNSNLDISYFGKGDVLRGWHWNQKNNIASYLTFIKGQGTLLNIRKFDGQIYGSVDTTIPISKHDILNGWSWDSSHNIASYVVLIGNKYTVINREFDGINFDKVKSELPFATAGAQKVRSWSYDTKFKNVSYHVWRQDGNNSILSHRSFDGNTFGTVEN